MRSPNKLGSSEPNMFERVTIMPSVREVGARGASTPSSSFRGIRCVSVTRGEFIYNLVKNYSISSTFNAEILETTFSFRKFRAVP